VVALCASVAVDEGFWAMLEYCFLETAYMACRTAKQGRSLCPVNLAIKQASDDYVLIQLFFTHSDNVWHMQYG